MVRQCVEHATGSGDGELCPCRLELLGLSLTDGAHGTLSGRGDLARATLVSRVSLGQTL